VKYHPDKIPQTLGRQATPQDDEYYNYLKLADETLKDPVKRFAYDRFGADMLEWKQCKTTYDFVSQGLTKSAPYYIGSLTIMIILGVLGMVQEGRYVSHNCTLSGGFSNIL